MLSAQLWLSVPMLLTYLNTSPAKLALVTTCVYLSHTNFIRTSHQVTLVASDLFHGETSKSCFLKQTKLVGD